MTSQIIFLLGSRVVYSLENWCNIKDSVTISINESAHLVRTRGQPRTYYNNFYIWPQSQAITPEFHHTQMTSVQRRASRLHSWALVDFPSPYRLDTGISLAGFPIDPVCSPRMLSFLDHDIESLKRCGYISHLDTKQNRSISFWFKSQSRLVLVIITLKLLAAFMPVRYIKWKYLTHIYNDGRESEKIQWRNCFVISSF